MGTFQAASSPFLFRRAARRALFGLGAAISAAGALLACYAFYSEGVLHEGMRRLYHRWKETRGGAALDAEAETLTEATVTVRVDPGAQTRPISPLIYGVAHSPSEPQGLRTLGVALHRWGGNTNTRHNWTINAWNSARDWQWRNHGGKGKPSETADAFIRANRDAGVASLITVPTMGWVARNGDNEACSIGVPERGGPPLAQASGAIAGYDPAENRRRTSVRSHPRKGRPFADPPAVQGDVFQDEWIAHLVHRFGPASQGGVAFYAMDNEPDLWDTTHTDVHPAQMGYDDVLANFLEYATAVKDVDPTARITGPVSFGWSGYFFSALDRGTDNFAARADHVRHGRTPFLLWFLQKVRAHDQAKGRRTLDVLDVHYYPQAAGVYSSQADPATRALRLRTVRSLWDPTYRDESWIGEPVRLIPRLKEWIAEGYPGTKLGITEWNFGAEEDISGGLATAEALGVFGREGVDLACYWTSPKPGSFAYLAFQLLRNPEGKDGGLGNLSCLAQSDAPGRVSCFAAKDSRTGEMTLLLINKMPRAIVRVPLEIAGGGSGSVHLWGFRAQEPGRIVSERGPRLESGRVQFTLPPYSATLARFLRDK